MRQWVEFFAKYKAKFPESNVSCNRLFLEEAAIKANMSGYYDAYYRMYCRYQHVALRAIWADVGRIDGCTRQPRYGTVHLRGIGISHRFRGAIAFHF